MSTPVRHYRGDDDVTADELEQILALGLDVKQKPWKYRQALAGKTLAMIFQKKSTRTRVSFEVGMVQLGGHALFLSGNDIQIGRGETIADTARVLSRYCDLIMARVYGQSDVDDLARWSTVPVINGLSDELHPCQILADLLTIREHLGTTRGRSLAYVGDGNNMAHSLMIGGAMAGMEVRIASPEGYKPMPAYVARAEAQAERMGGRIVVVSDPREAVAGVDVVYTDVWASMGQEAEHQKRLVAFAGYEVTPALMALAKSTAIFMHCLPAHRGEEVAAEVVDGPQSVIFDEAENRLHAQKALMLFLMGRA